MESNSRNDDDSELDPRIQIELENLNTATDEINKLEIELDEADTAFRMLLSESTRRLESLINKLGKCIERARPYYDAVDIARKAQIECQKAAVLFQRSSEIHAAAKETVALAEQRFMSNQHEWQFDNAWQEMLNHATMKVMDAEHQKAEHGREHQKRATLFTAAEQKVQILEEKLKRSIIKSRPYFEEKELCYEQLNTQKQRIDCLKERIREVKTAYANSLKRLETISEEIHRRRKSTKSLSEDVPTGPREPGVGAERNCFDENLAYNSKKYSLPDFHLELEKCEIRSMDSKSESTCSLLSETDDTERRNAEDVARLKERVRELSIRPVYGGEGKTSDPAWETELNDSVNKLDRIMLMQECTEELNHQYRTDPASRKDAGAATAAEVAVSPSTASTSTADCGMH